jgi:hypothetical protein
MKLRATGSRTLDILFCIAIPAIFVDNALLYLLRTLLTPRFDRRYSLDERPSQISASSCCQSCFQGRLDQQHV